ncbi:MAG TPA: hypothetical protein VGF24_27215 [Vicinamibacterales bacterium]|jgi:hypothetical protein
MPATINDYYRGATERMKKEVDDTPDAEVLGRDFDEWCAYLVAKWGMEPIELDASRGEQLVENEREQMLRGYDIYTGRGPGARVKSIDVRIEIPVVPSDTLEGIVHHHLATNSYSLVAAYPPFEYDHLRGVISVTAEPKEEAVKRERGSLLDTIRRYNDDIVEQNRAFPAQVARAVAARRERVAAKHKGLDDLAAKVGIKLVKKAEAASAVPTAVRVRSKIAPIMPPHRREQERPVLDDRTFGAIMELLGNQCEQFERTPQAFAQLTEEGLRDVMLSSLNAVFEGAAGGETFRGNGKVDIHLQISKGEVFVCEIKFWAGPVSLEETVEQLRGRLTWKDSYGVAVMLSRNAGFREVLASAEDTIPELPGCLKGSLRRVNERHFVARFTIPADEARTAEIHVLVYNVYSAAPSKRAVKR